MTTIREKNLLFSFDDTWHAVKWDEHADYRNRIGKLEPTKAVDIVAVHGGSHAYFIEIKDFRGSHAEKKAVKEGLLTEIALKVRDTIAGVIGACHMGTDSSAWANHGKCWLRERITVIFWFEEEHLSRPGAGTSEQRRKAELAPLTDELKRHLRWLTDRVLIVNSRFPPELEGLRVDNLPGAGQPGRPGNASTRSAATSRPTR